MDHSDSLRALNLENLPHLHDATKAVSNYCQAQLRGYIDALAPLLRPRRVFGDHIEGSGRESAAGAEQNFAELRALYLKVAGRPFDLKRELQTPLESISTQLELHPWEYVYEIRTDRDHRAVTVTSPLTWVLSYSSGYSLSMLRQVIAGRQERNPEGVRGFVLRACVMSLVMAKNPGIALLLKGLRYRVEVRTSAQLGELPLVTLSAPLDCTRPADDVLATASALSGGSVFEEVLDTASLAAMTDPIREQVSAVLRDSGLQQ